MDDESTPTGFGAASAGRNPDGTLKCPIPAETLNVIPFERPVRHAGP